MRISLVGCGKVGVTILYYLKGDHKIIGAYDPDKNAQKRAVRILGIKKPIPYPGFLTASDAVFIATPDEMIKTVSNRICKHLGNNTLLVHFSGWLPAEILPRARGSLRCAVHPFASFPKLIIPPPRPVYPLFIQGGRKALDRVGRIFRGKHFKVSRIGKKEKARYHLMGVMGSNLLVSLVAAVNKLTPRGIGRSRSARSVILPLIEETLGNLKQFGLGNALSGPIKRGDLQTVKAHLKMLRKDKNLTRIYRSLSENIVDYAPKAKIKTLRKLLMPK
jgi:predicted short-subunit dehydrogenase-like oxidoreductase (DUF2520 family)